jgi:hypothetical protein
MPVSQARVAPKGRNPSAQGNALGFRIQENRQALKGRNSPGGPNEFRPFRARIRFASGLPRALPWADEWLPLWGETRPSVPLTDWHWGYERFAPVRCVCSARRFGGFGPPSATRRALPATSRPHIDAASGCSVRRSPDRHRVERRARATDGSEHRQGDDGAVDLRAWRQGRQRRARRRRRPMDRKQPPPRAHRSANAGYLTPPRAARRNPGKMTPAMCGK